jgi:hypothetical protein
MSRLHKAMLWQISISIVFLICATCMTSLDQLHDSEYLGALWGMGAFISMGCAVFAMQEECRECMEVFSAFIIASFAINFSHVYGTYLQGGDATIAMVMIPFFLLGFSLVADWKLLLLPPLALTFVAQIFLILGIENYRWNHYEKPLVLLFSFVGLALYDIVWGVSSFAPDIQAAWEQRKQREIRDQRVEDELKRLLGDDDV